MRRVRFGYGRRVDANTKRRRKGDRVYVQEININATEIPRNGTRMFGGDYGNREVSSIYRGRKIHCSHRSHVSTMAPEFQRYKRPCIALVTAITSAWLRHKASKGHSNGGSRYTVASNWKHTHYTSRNWRIHPTQHTPHCERLSKTRHQITSICAWIVELFWNTSISIRTRSMMLGAFAYQVTTLTR